VTGAPAVRRFPLTPFAEPVVQSARRAPRRLEARQRRPRGICGRIGERSEHRLQSSRRAGPPMSWAPAATKLPKKSLERLWHDPSSVGRKQKQCKPTAGAIVCTVLIIFIVVRSEK